jgi:hypothetical protein
MERAHEIHGHHEPAHSDSGARRIAVLISILAAALALVGMGEKSAQNAYLTHHIAVSDDWAFYQAKNLRSVVRGSEANLLASLPNAGDAAVQARVKDAREYEARMRDDPKGGEGMKQLVEKAHQQEHLRDHAFHRYHAFELVGGALEIAIVLASVSVVTRVRALAVGGGIVGGLAIIGGLAVVADLV